MKVMSALSQKTRLDAFRRLVASPEGMSAGDIAAAVGVQRSLMSAHLAVLSAAGLVKVRREGKSLIYQAVTRPVLDLVDLLRDVCPLEQRNGTS